MARLGLPRGTVTFLFTDIEGSTRLLHELGADAYERAMAEHRRVVREVVRRHSGVEVDTQGDAFFIAFASAGGAVAAVLEAQRALASGPVTVRMGVHTGTPALGEEGYVGADVHLGARIAAAGHGGQVLLSQATRELVEADVEDLGEHRLKDFEAPVWIFQLGSKRFPPLRTISNTNLPRPASSFVGRSGEIGEVVSLLRDGRLVTLHGPGGSGKTRLAIEAAAELVPECKNGVFWVGLAALRDPALVLETIRQTLGAKDELADHVGERELLLLLDNFEQVVDAAADLSTLLSACPNLRLLVTSRELLRIDGERAYSLPPLAERDAVELFCQRSGLEPDHVIAELCSRLDKLPLALELAAARASVLSPAQMLERLSQRLDLLKGGRDADPRQQTLRATIAWSHDLLDQNEQRLFAQLAVFRGGCTLDAAEHVTAADLDTLQSLVDKSLLRRTNERFWMLETIREYAQERLAESGAEEEFRRRQAAYVLRFAEAAGLRTLEGPRFSESLAGVAAEHDNIRSALEWARDRDESELLTRLTAAVSEYWRVRGLFRDARTWLHLALERASAPTEARTIVLGAAAGRAIDDGEFARAAALIAEFRDSVEQADDKRRLLQAMNLAAHLSHVTGDPDAAKAGVLAAKELAAELGDRGQEAAMAVNLGVLSVTAGDCRAAVEYSAEAAALFRELEDETGVTRALLNLGWSAHGVDDVVLAEDSFRQGLLVAARLGANPWIAEGVGGLAAALVAMSDVDRGAQLLGAASSLREELGLGPGPSFEEQIQVRAAADARAALGEEEFASAWARGQTMTPEKIVELAVNTPGVNA